MSRALPHELRSKIERYIKSHCPEFTAGEVAKRFNVSTAAVDKIRLGLGLLPPHVVRKQREKRKRQRELDRLAQQAVRPRVRRNYPGCIWFQPCGEYCDHTCGATKRVGNCLWQSCVQRGNQA